MIVALLRSNEVSKDKEASPPTRLSGQGLLGNCEGVLSKAVPEKLSYEVPPWTRYIKCYNTKSNLSIVNTQNDHNNWRSQC